MGFDAATFDAILDAGFGRREGVNVKKNKPSLLRTAAGGDFLFCSNPRDN
jgi:hypothetical protein